MYFASKFLALLDLMIDHLRRISISDGASSDPIRLSTLSYNLILTQSYMHIVPRTAETFKSPTSSEISVNSLGFAGMLLVKDEESLKAVKEVGVLNVLKEVAYRPVKSGETSEEAKDPMEDLLDDEPAAEEKVEEK